MILRFFSRAILAGSLGACLTAEQLDMRPFPTDWRGGANQAGSVAFLLDAPAGKDGFIRAKDGHLVKPNGARFRLWGVNFTGPASFPSKEEAPIVAAHLAAFGINCVRFHFLDQPAPGGLLDATRNDTRALDRGQTDRFDFFVAELKKRGIYSNINLNVARIYKEGDGVRDHEYLGFAKGLTYFDERLIFLQKEYARQLLTHHNPYTKTEYRSDPAVVIVELVNENSLIDSWVRGKLLGKNTHKNRDAWPDITAGYAADLTRKYHGWLAAKGLPPVPRLQPAEFAGASTERFRREATFYLELQDAFFEMMCRYLKEELGVKALIVGTSDHGDLTARHGVLRSTARLDVVDAHSYWQHPRYTTGWGGAFGFRRGFEIANTPMAANPLDSTVVRLSGSAVAGKPFIVSEVNDPFPSEYACEGIPILAAYGAFQNWDGIFWYNFESIGPEKWEPSVRLWFNIRADPVKMAQVASGALTFLRADVRPAVHTVTRTYTEEQVAESLRLPAGEAPFYTPGYPRDIPLRHAIRIGGFDGPATVLVRSPGGQPFVSDTNELTWRKGAVAVDAARTQALVGYSKAFPKALANLSVTVKNGFAAITLVSLDSAPLSQTARMLLTAGSRSGNSGMKWNDRHTSLEEWGTAPAIVEPVAGAVTLRNVKGALSIEATPLDGGGRPMGQAIHAKKTPTGWELPIGGVVTVWYGIQVRR